MGAFEACRVCTERYRSCHDVCPKYREAKQSHDKTMQKRREMLATPTIKTTSFVDGCGTLKHRPSYYR